MGKQPNGLEHYSKQVDNRKLRLGYTTGSCAAAAAKAAAYMLLSGKVVDYINLMTPKGIPLHLEVLNVEWGRSFVSCAIRKDAGDDPDVTNGVLIYAKVSYHRESNFSKKYNKNQNKIYVGAGVGVGIVTKPGLEQPQGASAINRVPRQMITEELTRLCKYYQVSQGLDVEISVPQGVDLAEKTFNPRLGIMGGISILGTTGIVEPMSESALISSIHLELKQQAELGKKSLIVTPGNYGQEFLQKHFPLKIEDAVKCSNFVGETIDYAAELGIEDILFVAHIGKFIKVAGGIFQTHSRIADARVEILTANAVLAGASQSLLKELMQVVTTEEGIRILEEAGYLEQTMEHIMERILFHLKRRSLDRINLGAIVFSSELGKRRQGSGELGRTANSEEIIEKIRRIGA